MAEIGIIASVISVASIGCHLSSRLNAVGCDIASAGVEILSISKGVTMFSLILKQVGQALQAVDSVHSSEAVEIARQIANECKLVFDEIKEKLDKVTTQRADGSMAPSIQQRFKWSFKKGGLQLLLTRLESLKTDLMLMLQILQMGKLMAAVSSSTPKEEIAAKNDLIAQQRAETQNLVVVRYLHMSRLDHLYNVAEHEEAEEQYKRIEQRTNGGADSTQLTIAATPEYGSSSPLIKLPIVLLSELDTTLNQIKESPKDMLRISESVIDPLLNRWTRWQEIHDWLETRSPSRYSPPVQNLHESDGDKPSYRGDFLDREENPRGYYPEGTTTDWRKPRSIEANEEAAGLRKKSVGLQPSISVDSSDEDSHAHRRPKKRAPSRHVIDSNSETSDSESQLPRQQRRSNADAVNGKRSRYPPQRPSPSQKSYTHSGEKRGSFGGRSSSSPIGTPNSTPRSSVSAQSPRVQRPTTNPVQGQYQPAYTSPLPPLHTTNTPNPHAPYSPYSPSSNTSPQPPAYQNYSQPQHFSQTYAPRHMAPQSYRMAVPPPPQPRPQDGKAARSPSRYSGHTMHSRSSDEDLKKSDRSQRTKNVARGALGGGAISGIMEALHGLEL